jgi:uncharacterized membrane protein
MSTASILAIALGALLMWFGNRVQKPNLVKIETLSRKKIKNGEETAYRQLNGRFYILDGILIGVYGIALMYNPSWLDTKIKIIYFLLVVAINEALRQMSRKYYVS